MAAYMAQKREQHQQEHGKQVMLMESFSHPACSGLSNEDKRSCPLLTVQWSAQREVSGGVALEGRWTPSAASLQRRLLCHIAFGKVHGKESSCPLHVERITVNTQRRGDRVILRMITGKAELISELRERVKQIVRKSR